MVKIQTISVFFLFSFFLEKANKYFRGCVYFDPFKLYSVEPWVEDLFRNIKQKKEKLKKAAVMTETTNYGQLYRQYREGLARLSM